MTAAFLGLAVGLLLALTGAGGSIVAVPALVMVLGLPMAQAGPMGLVAVALSAGLGAALALRQGQLRYKAATLMALSGALVSPAGLWVAHRTPEQPLALLFSAVLAWVGWRTWRKARAALAPAAAAPEQAAPVRASAPCRYDATTGRLRWNSRCALRLAGAGAGAGFLSGLLGVGGGFVIVPALLLITDLPMAAVTATSVGVIAIISASGVASAAWAGSIPWSAALPFAAGAMAGMLGGRLLASRWSGPRLQQGFGVFAMLSALALALRSA
ncbi:MULTISPECIES: sulfite exporter TauE/SafE family protein [Ramlibacter]|uniref:Probable membrane transporter protein n=1 Tax=Ramlibacter aquaticus TaxID=2780094 RepID=A0ABR9SI31_9BURK|nr:MULTISPECIES: sulfite exporter TauE/SafE family protein [Ramlibacter]MBE7941554.1 sulfite exporter TauE/SafE family protein [Ramlibacter aquaticus]